MLRGIPDEIAVAAAVAAENAERHEQRQPDERTEQNPAQLEIEAPIETCFEAIVDYESFPEWQRAVVDTEVLDRHKDGLGKKVNLIVDVSYAYLDPRIRVS